MADIVIPDVAQMGVLNELIDTGNFLDALKVGLFGNDYLPNRNTTYANLTPCAFSGYALSSLVVWSDAFQRVEDDQAVIIGDTKVFRSATATPFVPGVVYGWFLILPGTPNILRAVQRFESPVVIDRVDRVVAVTPTWPFNGVMID